MTTIAHEKLRVEIALLESERQKVKLLVAMELARKLQDHARAICAELAIIATEGSSVFAIASAHMGDRPKGRRVRKTAETCVTSPQAAASFTRIATRPTCSFCPAEEVAVLSIGPDLR